MSDPDIRRGPGAPTAAVPAMCGFLFLFIIAPPFYVLAICMGLLMSAQNFNWLNYFFGGSVGWIIITLAGIIYPSVRGKVWAIRLIRWLSFPALLALLGAVIGDAVFYFHLPAGQRGIAVFAFWFALAPLLIGAYFLIEGLLHQPWFDPNATPEEIGPSRGTIGDFNKQAGMDDAGRLSPEKLAAALAAPAPPPRWLCYTAPPIAAARMKAWWHVAISAPLCLAALALVAFLPIRAIFVYALMGTFADRLRAIQAYRKTIALARQPNDPALTRPRQARTRRKPEPE